VVIIAIGSNIVNRKKKNETKVTFSSVMTNNRDAARNFAFNVKFDCDDLRITNTVCLNKHVTSLTARLFLPFPTHAKTSDP